MKKGIFLALFVLCFLSGSSLLANKATKAEVGKEAPGFELLDSNGKKHSLKDYEGKIVVLEWINFDCPFVKKHYRSGNMPELQKHYKSKGIVWLSICSSAPSKQGYFEKEGLKERLALEKTNPTAYLLDPTGEVGKLYGAVTTPHMYVIDTKKLLVYSGAIDSIRSTRHDDIKTAKSYVRTVLDAILKGEKSPLSQTKPYGCSVKYK